MWRKNFFSKELADISVGNEEVNGFQFESHEPIDDYEMKSLDSNSFRGYIKGLYNDQMDLVDEEEV